MFSPSRLLSSIQQPDYMEKDKVFTLSQVAQHNSKQDCWLVINGKVLDVTKFLEAHPGGEEVLLEFSGTDATRAFDDIGHSKAAESMLLKYKIGHLPGFNFLVTESDIASDKPFQKEMKAFVIKDESRSSKKSLVEVFVPLFVVVFYLSCRYFYKAM